eukprot:TRINITY_DN50594_c0_g1_i1.p1 TRINITY_DN50594_c0_g1~~TRINITY_DN50594_c0_g1_i1.p1  ORF type:complete len:496 (-),score=124.15 TRINITY_DN50594_c0_g1_i1:48-1511(-)
MSTVDSMAALTSGTTTSDREAAVLELVCEFLGAATLLRLWSTGGLGRNAAAAKANAVVCRCSGIAPSCGGRLSLRQAISLHKWTNENFPVLLELHGELTLEGSLAAMLASRPLQEALQPLVHDGGGSSAAFWALDHCLHRVAWECCEERHSSRLVEVHGGMVSDELSLYRCSILLNKPSRSSRRASAKACGTQRLVFELKERAWGCVEHTMEASCSVEAVDDDDASVELQGNADAAAMTLADTSKKRKHGQSVEVDRASWKKRRRALEEENDLQEVFSLKTEWLHVIIQASDHDFDVILPERHCVQSQLSTFSAAGFRKLIDCFTDEGSESLPRDSDESAALATARALAALACGPGLKASCAAAPPTASQAAVDARTTSASAAGPATAAAAAPTIATQALQWRPRLRSMGKTYLYRGDFFEALLRFLQERALQACSMAASAKKRARSGLDDAAAAAEVQSAAEAAESSSLRASTVGSAVELRPMRIG